MSNSVNDPENRDLKRSGKDEKINTTIAKRTLIGIAFAIVVIIIVLSIWYHYYRVESMRAISAPADTSTESSNTIPTTDTTTNLEINTRTQPAP